MLDEHLSEKVSTNFKVVEMPFIPDYEYMIRMSDFEKSLLAIMSVSLLVSICVVVL